MKRMWKRVLAMLLVLLLVEQICPVYALETAEDPDSPVVEEVSLGMDAFVPEVVPEALPFTDVPETKYYYQSVMALYGLGLVEGRTETTFVPNGYLTTAECTVLAVRIYEKYHGLSTDFTPTEGEAWYSVYLEKALEYGILKEGLAGVDELLPRADALCMLYYTLPVEELPAIRQVDKIPDLLSSADWYEEIMALYEAGIVCGRDEYGTLDGDSPVNRGEYITLLARLIDPGQRVADEITKLTGMEVFSAPTLPMTNVFSDVSDSDWFCRSVVILQNLGLVSGRTETTFVPKGNVTLAEAVTLSVRIYEMYHGLDETQQGETVWYENYIASGIAYGILPADWTDYTQPANREQVAYLMAHTLPAQELAAVNDVTTFKDMEDVVYQTEVLSLYQAGILQGRDEYGTFDGEASITRAELSAMLVRLILPEERLSFTLKTWHDATILVIAGHGMKNDGNLDPGTCATVNGIYYQEYKETRIVAEYVVEALSEYAEVIYYPSDSDPYSDCLSGTFADQVDFSAVDYALTIHFNSYNGAVNGSTMVIAPAKSDTTVEAPILTELAGLGFSDNGYYRRTLVVQTNLDRLGIPNSLVEVCYLDNASDMRRYASDKQGTAEAIALGLAKGLGLTE